MNDPARTVTGKGSLQNLPKRLVCEQMHCANSTPRMQPRPPSPMLGQFQLSFGKLGFGRDARWIGSPCPWPSGGARPEARTRTGVTSFGGTASVRVWQPKVCFPPYAVIQLRILNGSSCPIPVIARPQPKRLSRVEMRHSIARPVTPVVRKRPFNA